MPDQATKNNKDAHGERGVLGIYVGIGAFNGLLWRMFRSQVMAGLEEK